jgi:Fe-S-cluster containining protein
MLTRSVGRAFAAFARFASFLGRSKPLGRSRALVSDLTEEPPLPECLACGTCCFSLMPNFVRVTGDDHARLAERAERLVWFEGIRAFMRMKDGHCAALEIDHGSGRFVCTVYEERPQVCRDLARASGACRGERQAKADRPLIALGRAVPRSTKP